MVTERQKKVLKNIEKGMPMSKAMREAGYSKATAHNPQLLKKRKSWNELIDRYLPEEFLAGKTKELLSSKHIRRLVFADHYKEEEVHLIMKKLGFKRKQYVAFRTAETRYTKDGEPYDVWFWEVSAQGINGTDVSKGLEHAFKLRGNYAPEQIEVKDVTQSNWKKRKEELLNKPQDELLREVSGKKTN